MATYQPIVTGYKPEGALGGLYAGESAAMARQQTESANLADLFDAYQKQAAVQQAQFNLGESQYKAPNERAVSDLAGATAIGQNNPAYLTAMRGGQLGQAQSLTAAGSRDTALLPSSIEAGKAENISKVATAGFTEAAKQVETIAGLAQQSPLMAASYINQNITDPAKKGEYLRLLQAGQIPALQQQFALQNQAHMAEMDKERYKGGIDLEKARIAAAGYTNSATTAANAQMYAANKDILTQSLQRVEQNRKQVEDSVKEIGSNLAMTIRNAGGKETPMTRALDTELTNAKKELVSVNTQHRQLFDEYRKLANFGGGAKTSGSGSTTTTEKVTGQAALDVVKPNKIVITDDMLASGPQAAPTGVVKPPPSTGTYRVLTSLGGDQAMVILADGKPEVRSLKQLQSYGFKPE